MSKGVGVNIPDVQYSIKVGSIENLGKTRKQKKEDEIFMIHLEWV